MVARIKGAFENKMAVEDPDPKLKDALAEEVPPGKADAPENSKMGRCGVSC